MFLFVAFVHYLLQVDEEEKEIKKKIPFSLYHNFVKKSLEAVVASERFYFAVISHTANSMRSTVLRTICSSVLLPITILTRVLMYINVSAKGSAQSFNCLDLLFTDELSDQLYVNSIFFVACISMLLASFSTEKRTKTLK